MLDSNLPTYYFKPSTDKSRPYDSTLLFTQFDSAPEPRYTLKQPDPSTPTAKNCFAAGLFDAFSPDVLFGEVLVKPEWTHPTLSQDEIRRNGGVAPRPQPIIPAAFTIQLYSPEQQIVVTEKTASWGGTSTYAFSMPQYTFRTPSASTLDRATNDPAADPSTPQVNFVWKRDGRKDLSCFMTGKSTDTQKRKKGGKEPDIAVAMFSGFKDLTIYESNLHRVEIEDYKGLEVVLLLSATVIRDIYSGQKKDCFNVGEAPRKNSGGLMKRKPSMPILRTVQSKPLLSNGLPTERLRRQSVPQENPYLMHAPPPAPDPRTQWELQQESARLRQNAELEKRAQEARQRERVIREEEESRRVRKMVETEEKERRRRKSEVDKETERLRKKYGNQSNLTIPMPQSTPPRMTFPSFAHSHGPGYVQQQQFPALPPRPMQTYSSRPQTRPNPGPYPGPYLMMPGHAPPAASQSSFFHGGGTLKPRSKKSFWGLRSLNDAADLGSRLSKQRSTIF